jgi:NAD-dependent SIR2 family protein deacetylase
MDTKIEVVSVVFLQYRQMELPTTESEYSSIEDLREKVFQNRHEPSFLFDSKMRVQLLLHISEYDRVLHDLEYSIHVDPKSLTLSFISSINNRFRNLLIFKTFSIIVPNLSQSLANRVSIAAEWIFHSKYLVVFTGAGISTDSGIADFRGPNGLWTRRDQGLPPPPSVPLDQARPNAGHLALVQLQVWGYLKFLISQNVDNLHLRSGIHNDLLAELHGNYAQVRCRDCEKTYPRVKFSIGDQCECGGRMISSIIDFKMALPASDLRQSYIHSELADIFLVAGSSLVVIPAAYMPEIAQRRGAKLIIINREPTPFDNVANLRFFESTSEVLSQIVDGIKKMRDKIGL